MNRKIPEFITYHFRHFNAGPVVDAAVAYKGNVLRGGKMMVTLAGAIVDGGMGLSFDEMIGRDKVHVSRARERI